MIEARNRVVMTENRPERNAQAGDVGAVVHVYEIEFVRLDEQTAAVGTGSASAVRPVASTDVTHARMRE